MGDGETEAQGSLVCEGSELSIFSLSASEPQILGRGRGRDRAWAWVGEEAGDGQGYGKEQTQGTDMGRNTGTGICLLPRLSSRHLYLASFGSSLAFLCVSKLHPNWRQS